MSTMEQALNLVRTLSEDDLKAIIALFGSTNQNNRIGIAKGLFNVPEDFDSWNGEITDLMENGECE